MGERTDDRERIGTRGRDEVREVLRRRRLAPKTIGDYLGVLVRAEAWSRAQELCLDDLGAEDLERFASTLPQTRPSLALARSALASYFVAIGRRDAPRLELAERIGRSGRDPDEGFAALELVRRLGSSGSPEETPTWRDAGYDKAWLRTRLVARQLTRRTAVVYVDILLRLQRWCELVGSSIETATAVEIEAFASTLPNARSSRRLLKSGLIHYYAIIRRPEPPTWVIRVPRKPRMLSRALEDDDARRLAAAAIERDDRMGLAVIIGLYLGLRRFEIAQLCWSDFDSGWLRVVGKGDVEASLPVHPVVQRYLDRQRNDTAFVFPGAHGGPVNPTTVWAWVRRVSVEAGLDAVPTHVLRHTALTVGNDATGDLRAVQDFARHAQVETTAGYTRATVERLNRIAEAVGDFYERDVAAGELADPDPQISTLSFPELVATTQGAFAIEPWARLARALVPRGWRLEGTLAGEGNLSLSFSPLLRAWVCMGGPALPATFHITRSARAERDGDYETWDFADPAELTAVAGLFERGLPVPEAGSGETDGRPWVLDYAGAEEAR
jgi:integrase